MTRIVPVVDLFAGPGGLAEGFSACRRTDGRRRYRIALSVEKDRVAHRTLLLRAFLRKFATGFPPEYYDFLNGVVAEEPDWAKLYPKRWAAACDETKCLELGSYEASVFLRDRIAQIRAEHGGRTVLLGGPPCQAYSVIGRSRNAGNAGYNADEDDRQSLYEQYVNVLWRLQPAIAVMENVKGMLSARLNDKPIFPEVMRRLRHAGGRDGYRLFALAPRSRTQSWYGGPKPEDFLVHAEARGVPQTRHRLFVICVRRDVAEALAQEHLPQLEPECETVALNDVIGSMPRLRSRLSDGDDPRSWQDVVRAAHDLIVANLPAMSNDEEARFRRALARALATANGSAPPFRDARGNTLLPARCPLDLREWIFDEQLRILPNNETRAHMPADVARYLFAAAFGRAFRLSPKTFDFPDALMPGKVLAAIYDRWDTRLLEQNVRVFLQHRGKVNKGIRATLENEPNMFFAYNNGITATAEEVEIDDDGGRLLLRRLKNFQIVNGGQTTASIHVARRGKVDVSQTFVQMKLSVVDPERANSLVPKISEFANSQNRVSAADFFANHPFHVRMEEFSRRIHAPSPDGTFRQSKWFYERARGQYADARAGLTSAQRKKFDLENPRRQLFTKTDLAKFVNVWQERPHEVSLGAQKNFAAFARRIGQQWQAAPDDFNEAWYREAVAKAIVFKATERLVTDQAWYQGGYRANIVAYAIAKTAHDARERSRAVDFQDIWRRQALPPAMTSALVAAAESVHDVLVAPPEGISNVTEWAKKQACWNRVSELVVAWPRPFLNDLISTADRRDAARSARREQRVLNSVEAQIAVVNAGSAFWAAALEWGTERGLLTPTEAGVLGVAANPAGRTPTERQASRAVEALSKLQSEGYGGELSVGA